MHTIGLCIYIDALSYPLQHAAVINSPGPSSVAFLETHYIISETCSAGNPFHSAV